MQHRRQGQEKQHGNLLNEKIGLAHTKGSNRLSCVNEMQGGVGGVHA